MTQRLGPRHISSGERLGQRIECRHSCRRSSCAKSVYYALTKGLKINLEFCLGRLVFSACCDTGCAIGYYNKICCSISDMKHLITIGRIPNDRVVGLAGVTAV